MPFFRGFLFGSDHIKFLGATAKNVLTSLKNRVSLPLDYSDSHSAAVSHRTRSGGRAFFQISTLFAANLLLRKKGDCGWRRAKKGVLHF